MADAELPLPTFLVIGAQKSATRWLRMNLGEHPDVFAASAEISYFNSRPRIRKLGLDWYRQQFEGWNGEPLVGEATPGYMIHRHKPHRMAEDIQSAVPGVRLIAILRNPIDRARSALVHHITHERIPAGTTLVEFARATPPEDDRMNVIAGGWYAASLAPFIDRFGDQLLVLLHDDIATDPVGLYKHAADHIGASTEFVPASLSRVRHSNQKRSPGPSLSQQDRLELWGYFADDVAQLETMIGRDLSMWRPTSSAAPAATDR